MTTAQRLINLAARLLLPHRRDWAEAMRAELTVIPPAEQYGFALGCLWAALCERINLMKALVALGRWGVGLVTVLYGALFAAGFVFYASVLLGHTHDHYYDLLLHHHPAVAAQRLHDYPLLLIFNALMAPSNIIAGICLITWRAKAFIWACLATLTGPAIAVIYGVHCASPIFISFLTSFIPWALLVVAAAFLWWLDRGPSKPAIA